MPSDGLTRTLHRSNLLVEPLPVFVSSGSQRISVEEGTCLLGSGSRCQLLLDDPTVSRIHAELSLVPEGVRVRDLGSRNGTFYQGVKISSAIVPPGTRLLLGRAPVSIELDEDHLLHEATLGGALFRGMTGSSAAMLRLFTTISRLDGSLLPVLVRGDSGVGKELVASALHEGSRVATGAFVAINCGALSRELVASTLFGHTRGAFTGAVAARSGAFVRADEGTLFLDEIAELPLEIQATLLRIVETGEVTPVGQDAPRRVRVRLISATHRDLQERVRAGAFREDLYFRLAVVTLKVPTLAERREDIPALARSFARQEGAPDLDADILAELTRREFPGNVRELRNAVLAYVVLGKLGDDTNAGASPVADAFVPRFDLPYLEQRDVLVAAFTRRYLSDLLEHTSGNQSEAARLASLDRTYLGRLLNRFGFARASRTVQ